MPDQGHLFIGQTVESGIDVLKIFHTLGVEGADPDEDFDDADDADEVFHEGLYIEKTILHHDIPFKVNVQAHWFEDYDTHIVGFRLTGRYKAAVLDHNYPHGTPDVLPLNLIELQEILQQVRTWWPNAQVLIADVHF